MTCGFTLQFTGDRMPIYEYGCKACGNIFEEWHQHADDIQEEPCPKCKHAAHRLISNTSFVLKGGGWYVTEYGNRKPDAASSGASTPKSVDAPATTAASSPVTKAEASPPPAKAESTSAPAPAAD